MAEKCPKLSAEIYPKVLAAYTNIIDFANHLIFLAYESKKPASSGLIHQGLQVSIQFLCESILSIAHLFLVS